MREKSSLVTYLSLGWICFCLITRFLFNVIEDFSLCLFHFTKRFVMLFVCSFALRLWNLFCLLQLECWLFCVFLPWFRTCLIHHDSMPLKFRQLKCLNSFWLKFYFLSQISVLFLWPPKFIGHTIFFLRRS